jgi:hypothetical protein
MLKICAYSSGGSFRLQCKAAAAPIVKGVHFFAHNVRFVTNRAFENLRVLNYWRAYAPKTRLSTPVPAHFLDERKKLVILWKDVMNANGGLGFLGAFLSAGLGTGLDTGLGVFELLIS